jgi:hypothetical protein
MLQMMNVFTSMPQISISEKEALPALWKFFTLTQNFGLEIKHFGTFSHAWVTFCGRTFLFPVTTNLIV